MHEGKTYDLDHPDDEARLLAEEHRRRLRFKAHYKRWFWFYELKEKAGEWFIVWWTVGVVGGTMRFIFAMTLCLLILATGYHLINSPNAYRELPTTEEEVMKHPRRDAEKHKKEGPAQALWKAEHTDH